MGVVGTFKTIDWHTEFLWKKTKIKQYMRFFKNWIILTFLAFERSCSIANIGKYQYNGL